MTTKLITKSAKLLEQREYTQLTSAQDRQRKSGGITHTIFAHDGTGEQFLVRAKDRVYKGLAPFGTGMVEHGCSERCKLVIYFDDRETFYVFDPFHVRENGEVAENYSKRPDIREWLEVPLSDGCTLSDYADGRKRPEIPEARDSGPNDTLTRFI